MRRRGSPVFLRDRMLSFPKLGIAKRKLGGACATVLYRFPRHLCFFCVCGHFFDRETSLQDRCAGAPEGYGKMGGVA